MRWLTRALKQSIRDEGGVAKMKVDSTEKKKLSRSAEVWRRYRKSPTAMIGLAIILVIILGAIFADIIVPYDYGIKQVIPDRLQGPSLKHLFGTDDLGRDLFARVIHGSRSSLVLGILTTAVATLIGGFLGGICAYYGNRVDNIIMRLLDVITSIPSTLLSLSIVAALGPGIRNLVIAITVSRVPTFARVIRSAVLNIVNQEYIEAAKAGGTRNLRIMLRHVYPNAMSPIIVQCTMSISQLILQAAGLSFLGMGMQPPAPEWGALLNSARDFMRTAPHLMLFPGIAIVLAALAFNLVGDGLRDAFDPRLKS